MFKRLFGWQATQSTFSSWRFIIEVLDFTGTKTVSQHFSDFAVLHIHMHICSYRHTHTMTFPTLQLYEDTGENQYRIFFPSFPGRLRNWFTHPSITKDYCHSPSFFLLLILAYQFLPLPSLYLSHLFSCAVWPTPLLPTPHVWLSQKKQENNLFSNPRYKLGGCFKMLSQLPLFFSHRFYTSRVQRNTSKFLR